MYKESQLKFGNSKSPVALVTGWTPMKKVDWLSPELYCVMGQLYSNSRGVSILIANLLNDLTNVTTIVCLEATPYDDNSNNFATLRSVYAGSYHYDDKRDCIVVVNPNGSLGFLDPAINHLHLQALRESTKLVFTKDVDTLEKVLTSTNTEVVINDTSKLRGDTWAIKLTGGSTKEPQPSEPIGHRIVGDTIPNVWKQVVQRIRTHGSLQTTGYGGQWQELISLVCVVKDEIFNPYMSTEELPDWCNVTKEDVQRYCSTVMGNTEPGNVKYTYGSRIRSHFGVNQIDQVVNKLLAEPEAASAVIDIWDVDDHVKGGSPCLNHMWFRIDANNKLVLVATFRSNDMFSAWISNAYGLRLLQYEVWQRLHAEMSGLMMGDLVTISHSAHIYDDCFAYADDLSSKPAETYSDPVGNFHIERTDKGVIIDHTQRGSDIMVKRYLPVRTKADVLKTLRAIALDNPTIQPYHIAYLGYEIGFALSRLPGTYTQDKH